MIIMKNIFIYIVPLVLMNCFSEMCKDFEEAGITLNEVTVKGITLNPCGLDDISIKRLAEIIEPGETIKVEYSSVIKDGIINMTFGNGKGRKAKEE